MRRGYGEARHMDCRARHGQAIALSIRRPLRNGREGRMAMLTDDDLPKPKPKRLGNLPLDLLGVDELRDYIAELQAEISRVEADIARKHAHRNAADAFFRKP